MVNHIAFLRNVSSKIVIAILNSTEVEDSVRNVSDFVIAFLKVALIELLRIFIAISRPLYVVVISFGVVHYVLSDSYRNKRYLYGGILLAIFSEIFLPMLMKYLGLII